MLTDKERQSALERLTQTRDELKEVIRDLSEQQARWKPAPDRWSILEYVEHLAISDDALVGMTHKALRQPAQPETTEQRAAREKKLRENPLPAGANQAPDSLRPTGRFESLADAMRAFLAARERTIEYARVTQDNLRDHFAPHAHLGPLDGYQWLAGNAVHAKTHIENIREVRALPNFPNA